MAYDRERRTQGMVERREKRVMKLNLSAVEVEGEPMKADAWQALESRQLRAYFWQGRNE